MALYWARHDEQRRMRQRQLFFARWPTLGQDVTRSRSRSVWAPCVRSQPAGATVYAVPFSEYRDGEPLQPRWWVYAGGGRQVTDRSLRPHRSR